MQLFADFFADVLLRLEEYRLLAMLAFIVLHVAAAALLLPCSQFTLLAGTLWGPVVGFALSSAGMLAAAATTHLLGRKVLAKRIDGAKGRFRRITDAVHNVAETVGPGWKPVLLLQGLPLVPASSTGYVFGVIGTPLHIFLPVTYIATLPQHALIVFSGTLLRDAVAVGEVRLYLAFVLPAVAVAFILLPVFQRRIRAWLSGRS